MLFLMGPRQVGKTTTAREIARELGEHVYLNWDNIGHRRTILAGPEAVARLAELDRLHAAPPLCVLDEIHKFARWKLFLKGLFDSYPGALRILVTGSAKLDVFRLGGDSLMGRYFAYRMHPLSVAEIVRPAPHDGLIDHDPQPIPDDAWEALLRFGGFPEPYLRNNMRFWRRWRRTRTQQLLREDLRDLTRVQELDRIEVLSQILVERAGQLLNKSWLARTLCASADSVRRWLVMLESLYVCFSLPPWSKNVARALRKERKVYLWDWSHVDDPGARAENFVASALLKSVHLWTDRGDGEFGLFFLRDKEKREVDFLVTRDGEPWFLVEVKTSGKASLSPSLERFQEQTGARHAFQVALDLPFVGWDCFTVARAVIVPARTFLAQLV
ncbi:MAG: ATP-binding protein [Acidobacteria bacterium]|nr:ATP-binding protein [Acidobacteriota bacterium]